MDTLTQAALGGAIGEVVLGRRVGRRAAAWGAACGVLPDLDVFYPFTDAVAAFTWHRGYSHSALVLALLAPVVAWLATRVHPDTRAHLGGWLLLAFLALETHPLLDCFTVYGTQVGLPFSDHPVAWSTIFIIDPLYTIPLLAGLAFALGPGRARWPRAGRAGLGLSTAYLLATVLIKAHVDTVVEENLARAEPAGPPPYLTTPAPFNTLLWRVVVMDAGDDGVPGRYREGFYSVLDPGRAIRFHAHRDGHELLGPVAGAPHVRRLVWFTKGFYRATQAGSAVRLTDLRMGALGYYVFSFRVAERASAMRPVAPLREPAARGTRAVLAALLRRIWDPSVDLEGAARAARRDADGRPLARAGWPRRLSAPAPGTSGAPPRGPAG